MALNNDYKDGFIGGLFAGMLVTILLIIILAIIMVTRYVPPGGVLS